MQNELNTSSSTSVSSSGRRMLRFLNLIPLYALVAPAFIGILLFSYWPKIDTIRFAFYEWIPGSIVDFTGLKNFRDAWADPIFAKSLALVGLLLVANLFKMIPSIAGAILLHRLKSDRARYLFQVCFVVPMVIPGLVWLLLWKGFMDPNVGLVNAFLNLTGLMNVLVWIDNHSFLLADFLYPATWLMDFLFTVSPASFQPAMIEDGIARQASTGTWALLICGVLLMCFGGTLKQIRTRWLILIPILLTTVALMGFKSLIWLPLVAFIATLIQRNAKNPFIAQSRMRLLAWSIVLIASLLIAFTKGWNTRIGAFDTGQPAWLGHSELIVPSIIFWGFPWIHAVGVLIYLAGLQQISKDVYEAAELDGLSSLGKVFRLELPLILTQVRINLIFMTIATLNGYGFFLILLGPSGGPGGKGMVPGLYMYQQAFVENRYGYACALGLVVFVAILFLTIIYQKYLKVDK